MSNEEKDVACPLNKSDSDNVDLIIEDLRKKSDLSGSKSDNKTLKRKQKESDSSHSH